MVEESKMKKILTFILSLVLIAAVAWFAITHIGNGNRESNATYRSTYVIDMDATTKQMEALQGAGASIAKAALDATLGNMTFNIIDDTKFALSWHGLTEEGVYKREGNRIAVTLDGGTLEGTMEGDTITLDMDDEEMPVAVLVKQK